MAMTAWCNEAPRPLCKPLTASAAAPCLALTSSTSLPSMLAKDSPAGRAWLVSARPSSGSGIRTSGANSGAKTPPCAPGPKPGSVGDMGERGYMTAWKCHPSMLADGQCLQRHIPRVLDHCQIRLKSARRRNHIGHFLVQIDRGHGDHAVGVGIGMAGLVNHDWRPGIFFDAAYLQRRCVRLRVAAICLLQRRFKHDYLPLIRLAVRTARRVRVGDVLGNDIQPCALGFERCGGALNAGENLYHKRLCGFRGDG